MSPHIDQASRDTRVGRRAFLQVGSALGAALVLPPPASAILIGARHTRARNSRTFQASFELDEATVRPATGSHGIRQAHSEVTRRAVSPARR